MKLLFSIVIALTANLAAHAQLAVTVFSPKVAGQKAIVPLALKNGLAEKVESARAVMFLLDAEGKVVGQASHWIIGGDTNHPPLAVGRTNIYHFVVSTGGKAFVTNRLTVTHTDLPTARRRIQSRRWKCAMVRRIKMPQTYSSAQPLPDKG